MAFDNYDNEKALKKCRKYKLYLCHIMRNKGFNNLTKNGKKIYTKECLQIVFAHVKT